MILVTPYFTERVNLAESTDFKRAMRGSSKISKLVEKVSSRSEAEESSAIKAVTRRRPRGLLGLVKVKTPSLHHHLTNYQPYTLNQTKPQVRIINMRSKFKDSHPFEKRKAEAERIRQKYPDRIPVICEKADRSDIAVIDKQKYLVPSDLTVGQFVYVIRKRIKLAPEKAIFIFVDEVLPPTAALMSAIYEEHKDEDGFLYVSYSGENTFGDD